jgi:Fur family ferric uptake transcriptional regulator
MTRKQPEFFAGKGDIPRSHSKVGSSSYCAAGPYFRDLSSTEEHLTSEDLYTLVHRQDPTVGQTTVYRTLKLLTEAGLAREVRFGDNKTYYEHHYNHEHHDHMICTECGKVFEFFSQEIENLQDQMADKFGFKPTHHSLRLWGLCSECQRKQLETTVAASGAQPRVRVRSVVG